MPTTATRRDFLRLSLAGSLGAAVVGRPALVDGRSTVVGRLAVCSWSMKPLSAFDFFTKLSATGLARAQVALDPIRVNTGGAWTDFAARCQARGVKLVSGMIGTVGEDYTTLETIKATGGVVPDATWPETWKNIQADVALAQQMKLALVTFHAGFVPHDHADPSFEKVLGRLRQIAELCASKQIAVGLETGQETADTMAAFMKALDRPNVGVNFDPANMILYDKGDPIAALRVLGPWIKQCHLKDAVRTKTPGTWGEEVRLGTGQVDWKAFFRELDAVKFTGNLCIEREAGNQRVADIRAALEYVEKLGTKG
jgi:L-ribulose-5-phosphate 3-epimerase